MAHVIEQPPSRYAGHDPEASVPIRYNAAYDPENVPKRGMNNSDRTSIEMSRMAYSNGFPNSYANSGYFPDDLPERPAPPPLATSSWKQHWQKFFVFSLSSYSLIHTPDGKVRLRHLAMLTVLALRTGMSALSILSAVIKGSIVQIIIYSLLTLLGFWFTATCLAIIGDAEGEKPLWRFRITRLHFDIFLGTCVLIHAGLVVAWFFGLSGWGLEITSIGMWLAILGVASIAGWQPELPTYQNWAK
ncbi:hypothetical protein P171DRAFT_429676 [Karstenula rhodostoma CBS 690.94]|uniref:Uncharacterized protein n=1 Tax=Karstenula rhodostoma CBS 690.94 TaxID=1392251 RepID=A0A9P4PKE5_9PLEO|nr:hypothetical protein P171DRAFT_429676 [Karstenula rhodostoma CBS 690.94]